MKKIAVNHSLISAALVAKLHTVRDSQEASSTCQPPLLDQKRIWSAAQNWLKKAMQVPSCIILMIMAHNLEQYILKYICLTLQWMVRSGFADWMSLPSPLIPWNGYQTGLRRKLLENHVQGIWWEWVPHGWHVENCRHRLAFCMLHYCPLCLEPLGNQNPQENHSLTPPCCNVETVLNRSRKPGFTRKSKSEFSMSCGDLSANSVFFSSRKVLLIEGDMLLTC